MGAYGQAELRNEDTAMRLSPTHALLAAAAAFAALTLAACNLNSNNNTAPDNAVNAIPANAASNTATTPPPPPPPPMGTSPTPGGDNQHPSQP
jgi:hypothetical protein